MDVPRNPRHILVAALVPGCGHALLGDAPRGLMWIFFTVILGWVSTKLMPDHATFIGRHIGGVFIYGLSVIDAYKRAKIAWETWRHAQGTRTSDPPPSNGG